MAKKKKNTGVAYEHLVQGIFQAFHNEEGITTITVEQNKTLEGKTSSHQIDVYWKFQIGGIEYEVVVQAKDWLNRVRLGDLLQFKAVLDDLRSQPRGIFVTRTGYQEGARKFATKHGILLYELDEPQRKKSITITTEGSAIVAAEIRSFKVPSPNPGGGTVDQLAMGLKWTIFEPRTSNRVVHIDSAWLASNSDVSISSLSLRSLPDCEVILYNQNRSAIGSLGALIRHQVTAMRSENVNQKHIEHAFEIPTFLGPEVTGDLFLKIERVTYDLEIEVTTRPPYFELPGFVKLVLREISSQREKHFIARKQPLF